VKGSQHRILEHQKWKNPLHQRYFVIGQNELKCTLKSFPEVIIEFIYHISYMVTSSIKNYRRGCHRHKTPHTFFFNFDDVTRILLMKCFSNVEFDQSGIKVHSPHQKE
jgi:hypothetical protein